MLLVVNSHAKHFTGLSLNRPYANHPETGLRSRDERALHGRVRWGVSALAAVARAG
jgi:hypothetical protein